MENKKWSSGKEIREPIGYNEEKVYGEHEIEIAIPISQNQLNSARLFNSKYEYAKTLNKNISYLEVGVGYGQSAKMFIDTTSAKSADLLDLYDNAAGVRHPGGSFPKDSSMTHEEYIKDIINNHTQLIHTTYTNLNSIFIQLTNDYQYLSF